VADGSVAVVFGGPSPEHDISILTGLLAERVLRDAGVDVTPLYWTRTGDWVLCPPGQEGKDFLDGAPKGGRELMLQMGAGILTKKGLGSAKPLALDAALNCCHGGAGENGGLNAVFDQLGIPLTGGPPPLAALGMDKLAFGAVLAAGGVPTLARAVVAGADPGFPGPYIVKPRFGGSSIGIEVVEDLATARALATSSPLMRSGAVVEPFHAGAQDLTLAFRTHPALQVSLLEKTLSPAGGEGIYSYEQKYLSSQGLARRRASCRRRCRPRSPPRPSGSPGSSSPRPGSGACAGWTSCWWTACCTSTRSTPSRGRWACTCGRPRSSPLICCSARSRRRGGRRGTPAALSSRVRPCARPVGSPASSANSARDGRRAAPGPARRSGWRTPSGGYANCHKASSGCSTSTSC